ncbi:MAG: hypothetical protein MJZ34_02275 [Paludibacteraceae bacterium]|nr:hypothetical protein [Paludibacteraceae bacterium]
MRSKTNDNKLTGTAYRAYWSHVKDLKILSAEEETRLVYAWQKDRDIEARNILVVHLMKSLSQVIKSWPEQYDSLRDKMDIIQQEALYAIKAIDKFDPSKGVRLSSYAKHGAYRDLCKELSAIRPGMNRYAENVETLPVYVVYQAYNYIYSRPGTLGEHREELAKMLDIEMSSVYKIEEFCGQQAISFEMDCGDFSKEKEEQEHLLAHVCTDTRLATEPNEIADKCITKIDNERILKWIRRADLSKLERKVVNEILKGRFETDADIARKFKVTKQNVNSAKLNAFKKLKKVLSKKLEIV